MEAGAAAGGAGVGVGVTGRLNGPTRRRRLFLFLYELHYYTHHTSSRFAAPRMDSRLQVASQKEVVSVREKGVCAYNATKGLEDVQLPNHCLILRTDAARVEG